VRIHQSPLSFKHQFHSQLTRLIDGSTRPAKASLCILSLPVVFSPGRLPIARAATHVAGDVGCLHICDIPLLRSKKLMEKRKRSSAGLAKQARNSYQRAHHEILGHSKELSVPPQLRPALRTSFRTFEAVSFPLFDVLI